MASSALGFLKMPPPIDGHADDPAGSPPPASILLDSYGYLSSRTNGTTAEGLTRDGRTIQVTFWVASPPRVSSFSIHCDDYQPSVCGDLPRALYSQDDIVLFRFSIAVRHRDDGQHHVSGKGDHYFVYQAGSKTEPPSLHLVPIPHHLKFNDREAVLLRCRDQDMFYLALLVRSFHFYRDKQYNLHLYDSKAATWNTRSTNIDYSPKGDVNFVNPDSVLTIGGKSGSVAWVDLWRGILIYDIHMDNGILRYIPLPLSQVPNPPLPQVPNPLRGYAPYYRNITVLQDDLKLVEMARHPGCHLGLVAATKKMKISDIGSSGNNSWEEEFSIKFSEIPVHSLKFAQMLLPSLKLQVTADTKLTLESLHAGYPALSMQDADVVYIMQTPDPNKDRASAIAVDMRNKTIKDVAYFASGRYLGYIYTCLQSGISNYLDIWSSSRNSSWGNAGATSTPNLEATRQDMAVKHKRSLLA